LARPALLWEAILAAWAFRARRGLLPSRALLRWRVATAYGSRRETPTTEDVVRFLEWRRAFRADLRRRR
jgi:hypothetical protein